jgi:NTP pyrophosphatase (non-canonical NTP hydrolase)
VADGLSGLGRGELLALVDSAQRIERLRTIERDQAIDFGEKLRKERDVYLANLTSTQERCTELLLAVRAIGELAPLAEAIGRARAKHPKGPSPLRSLIEEVGEVASAMRRESPERVREELLDVAVVAVRLHAGEVDDDG